MAKPKIQYSCQNCGYLNAKWLGKCPACDAWNSFVEETPIAAPTADSLAEVRDQFKGLREENSEAVAFFGPSGSALGAPEWEDIESTSDEKKVERMSTGIAELDRVLGGGLVPDSFTLLGGDPGIGKSTLLLQMAKGLSEKHPHLKTFYASGEESIDQVRSRGRRLGIHGKGQIFLAAETQLERVFASVKELKPDVLIVDSLQTFSTNTVQSAQGSVTQVREVTARLMTLAKTAKLAVWIVGHVTKEGSIAGPKTVEHMVDTVLYFEGEAGQSYRLLRTVKNRFGSTRELGVFEMEGEGLKEVANPSSLFLTERTDEAVSGTAVGVPLEGSRPLLVELQALVAPSGLAVPRRTSVGMDTTRVSLLAAILEKHMKLPLAEQDLFFNVAGGLKLSEPACDLAAAASIWSSASEKPIPAHWAWIGELGLTGEVRRVAQIEVRLEEARRLGFSTVVLPRSTPKTLIDKYASLGTLRLIPVSKISELPQIFRESSPRAKAAPIHPTL